MRIFKHYIPLALLSLFLFESIVIAVSIFFSHYQSLILNEGYTDIIYHCIVIISIISISFYIGNMYDLKSMKSKREIICNVFIYHISGYVIIASLNFLIPFLDIDRSVFFKSLIFSFLSIALFRMTYSWMLNIEKLQEKVLIIGGTYIAERILNALQTDSCLGYRVLGCLTEGSSQEENKGSALRILGDVSSLPAIVAETNPEVVVIALSERRGSFPLREILECKLRGIRVEDWPAFYERVTGKILIQDLRPSWLIFADGFTRNHLARSFKRLIDTLLAAIGLCVSLPLVICVFILTKLDSKGPVIYRQDRVGENGKVFSLCKFRTMVADAEKESGPVWSATVDPRVTPLGKILRRTGIDEIPQLFNVLRGDMSFVGPRPERPHFVSELQRDIPYYAQRLAVKPGITGWAQVRYGYGSTVNDAIEKLQYDLYYIKNMSFFLDLLIILSTVHKVLFAQVAVQDNTGMDNIDCIKISHQARPYDGLEDSLYSKEAASQAAGER